MPLQIIRQDITKMRVDAIVNTTNRNMVGYSGVDLAIHTAAGPELDRECQGLPLLGEGETVVTRGYALPCRYIIHASAPVWQGGERNEPERLEGCYMAALLTAFNCGCETLAVPLIAAGAYGYPTDRALKLAVGVITDFLSDHEMAVYLCVFGSEAYDFSRKLFANVQAYIDDNYTAELPVNAAPPPIPQGGRFGRNIPVKTEAAPPVSEEAAPAPQSGRLGRSAPVKTEAAPPLPEEAAPALQSGRLGRSAPVKTEAAPPLPEEAAPAPPRGFLGHKAPSSRAFEAPAPDGARWGSPAASKPKSTEPICLEPVLPVSLDPLSPGTYTPPATVAYAVEGSLDDWLKKMDAGFADTLLSYISAKGITEVECYKRANIDKKTFWKIKNLEGYKPSKQTVLAFAVALRLTLEETGRLLNTVGLSLSHSFEFDVIIEYYISHGKYDIFEINETLFAFDQLLLGSM